jgi:hypothetical protein
MGMPIFAEHTKATSTDFLSYEIVDTDGVKVPGKARGIVISEAPMHASEYRIPKGTAEDFSLIVAFDPDEDVTTDEYHLNVNYLPFNFDGTQQLKLNPSELQYYTTKPKTQKPSLKIQL